MKYKIFKKGKEKMLFDILIASTAKQNQLKLITLDNDFEIIGEVFDYKFEIIN